MEEILAALAPGLAKLIESALADEYDQAKELEAILDMQRATADLRVRRMLHDRYKK
jgi:hypothetical protein